MITVYKSIETNFSHNGEEILNNCIRCDVTEELNGMFSCELEYPMFGNKKWESLIEGNIIKVPTPESDQLFRIYDKYKTNSTITVYARHIFYDLVDNFLEDVRPENLNGAAALDWILTRTQYTHSFTSMSDISTTNTAYFVRKNPVEAIFDDGGILERWGGELVRDNYTIKLLAARGLDRGVQISYGKNLTGIEETLNIDTVATRIMPVGRDGLLLPEKYIDSPYINNYPSPKIRKYEFTDIGVDDQTTEEQAYQLLRAAVANLYNNYHVDVPTANYVAKFIELSKTDQYKRYAVLERVYLGDTVKINQTKLNIDINGKVIKYVYDAIGMKYKEVQLGNFKENFKSDINRTINQISDIIETNKSDLQLAIEKATTLLTTALGGYVVKREGELLIMDTEDVNTAQKVWRWNLNGLGYSSTGINGPYGIAILMDGSINASFITTGTLSAGLIKTGYLRSFNNLTWINMDDGTFNFADKVTFDGNNFSVKLQSGKTVEEVVSNIGTKGLGMKVNYESFTLVNTGELYMHGFDANGIASDTDGFIMLNGVKITTPKQMINPNIQASKGYIMFDGTLNNWWIAVCNSSNIWTKYCAQLTGHSTTFTPAKNHYFVGYVEMDTSENITYAILWNNVLDYDQVTKLGNVVNLNSRMDSAEQKITPTAITSTVRSSTGYINDLGEKVSTTNLSSEIQQRANDVQVAFNGATGTFIIQNGKLVLKNSANNNVMWCDTNGWLNAANLYIYGNESPSNLEIGGTSASGNKGVGIRTPDGNNTVYIDFAALSKDATFQQQLDSGMFHRIASYAGTRDTLRLEVANKLDIRKVTAGYVEMTVQGSVSTSGNISTTQNITASGNMTAGNYTYPDGKWAIKSSNVASIIYGVNGGSSYIEVATPASGTWGADLWASDINLKENIVDANCNCLNKIMSIRHRSFDWKNGNGHVNLGYVAQELREVDESFAFGVKQQDGSYIYQPAVPMIIPSITKAMQEQQAIINALEARIKALEDRLAST